MVKPITLVAACIPVTIAILFAVALLGQEQIPFQAVSPHDTMYIEYIRHQVKSIQHGIVDNTATVSSQILTLDEKGNAQYTVTSIEGSEPAVSYLVQSSDVERLKALVKETGFSSINAKFTVSEGIQEYTAHTLKLNLNGHHSKVRWLEQNATRAFIPPLITAVEQDLTRIIAMAP